MAQLPPRRYCYNPIGWRHWPPIRNIAETVQSRRPRTPPPSPSSKQMITAIVLIKAEPQLIKQCATKLAGVEGVSQVYSVSGEWDLVAMVEVTDYEGVATVVTEHITTVPGIRSTQTLTAFRAYSKKDLEQAWDIGLE